jgi:hypothetical protein
MHNLEINKFFEENPVWVPVIVMTISPRKSLSGATQQMAIRMIHFIAEKSGLHILPVIVEGSWRTIGKPKEHLHLVLCVERNKGKGLKLSTVKSIAKKSGLFAFDDINRAIAPYRTGGGFINYQFLKHDGCGVWLVCPKKDARCKNNKFSGLKSCAMVRGKQKKKRF